MMPGYRRVVPGVTYLTNSLRLIIATTRESPMNHASSAGQP